MRDYDHSNVQRLAYAGLFTALITCATLIRLPVPATNGYVNLGDGVIFAAAALLGPFAGVVGGVGSALADLLAGYSHYALITLIIKGAMGLVAGVGLHYYHSRRARMRSVAPRSMLDRSVAGNALLFSLCELIMVLGYFFFEMVMYNAAAAAGALLPNVGQAVAGIILGCVFVPAIRRIVSRM
ncbi:MAG: ECF transporter S component [Christensenellales bacterium]